MGEPPRISEAEWSVMDVVWDAHPIAAQDVARKLARRKGWSETTVKTLLSRLVAKRALDFRRDGKRFLYEPALPRHVAVARESRSFLERVFKGEASPLLSHFVKTGRLTAAEVADLRRMLGDLGNREAKR